jgi:hypothetical protein
MAFRLSGYLPGHISDRFTDEALADFNDSLHALLISSPEQRFGPGLEYIRQLYWSVTGTGLGSRTANLKRLTTMKEATSLISVTALYYVDPWIYNTGYVWELPPGVKERLDELAKPARAVFPQR